MVKFVKTIVVALAAVLAASVSFGKIKVACVGDSITYGHGISDRNMTYPKQLGRILGEGYEVENFGVSGTTALHLGNSPYMATRRYQEALNFQPDIVVIKLGTNDSKAANMAHIDNFVSDVKTLISSFENLSSKPKVFLCLPVPAYSNGKAPLSINGDRIIGEIIPLLKKVAAESKAVEIIDLFAPLSGHSDMFPDKIHPNADGARVIAETVAKKIRK